MNFLVALLKEMLVFFNEISIYLIIGFFTAAVLHVLFPESIVKKHLGTGTYGSVIKSTLFGIPLPLCSCGVVPVAASLKNSGASNGASISFLIATPQVGADSFLVTYSLMGPIFAFFRIASSLITALCAGITVNLFERGHYKKPDTAASAEDETITARVKSIFSYVEYEMLGSIAGPLVVGIVIAGVIGVVIPEHFFEKYLDYPFLSMIIMLAVGIPLYVCSSASTPIAASLIMKGMSPGAALVFLLTGPATNAVTISTVINNLGKKTAFIYLISIGIFSIVAGHILKYSFPNLRFGCYYIRTS